ncbi:acetyl-CoA synthetase-like protein [Mycena galopus ATCC 62051]|nr:acetyl-CoA synthetase-like protein [Mycena galopus ATCC 62051]
MDFHAPQEGFKRPPSDQCIFLPEILVNHATENPTHPLYRYVELDGTLKTILWGDAVRAIHRVAQIVQTHGLTSSGTRPVVAILASLDQITYFSLIAGAMCAGCQVFPISPRNSKAATVHFLQSVGCSHLFVGPDISMQESVKGTISDGGGTLELIQAPSFEDLFKVSATPAMPPMPKPEAEDVALIMHSSGSVAFPKIIKISHLSLALFGRCLEYGEMDLSGQIWSAHTLPTFHLAGAIQLFWAAISGITLAVFPPVVPPTIPTAARVLEAAIAANAQFVLSVPAFLEVWARDASQILDVQKFKSVLSAGGPLQPAAGDILSKNHVNIAHMYGMTEVAGLSLLLPKQAPEEGWEYFEFSPHIDPVLFPLQEIPGVYRLVVKQCATHIPAVINTMVEGVPAFDTNDLLVPHPTNKKLWKIYGRQDDQIMHSNGEKTNPGPLEAIVMKDSRVGHALIFGRSEFKAGILIFPAEPFCSMEPLKVIDFRRNIWPAVQEANQFAPSHSRIFKELILVADPLKPVELSVKGTPRREATLQKYQEEIRDIYDSVKRSSLTHLIAPDKFDISSAHDFVRSVVAEIMVQTPADDEDMFQHGCDSLQATWIRNSILHALRSSEETRIVNLPDDFVYSRPTIRLLSEFLAGISSGSSVLVPDLAGRASEMDAMVLKYTRDFPKCSPTAGVPTDDEVLLVTGTTGAFGSHVLAHSLAHSQFRIVYALNRPGTDIQERQRSSFIKHGIKPELLTSPKLRLLEGNLTKPTFGLAASEFTEIRTQVTSIIHNGEQYSWQVDFNISLSSLEPCVKGTRNLVDFALTSPQPTSPRFIFVSTAGVFRNFHEAIAPEARILDSMTSAGMGYAESKWVTEQVLDIAAERADLNAVIVRPGQLSGGVGGAWKESEWFPTLLRSSQLLGHLPGIPGTISWVPIHDAAKILVEMRTSGKRYLHLTHPQPIPFSDVLLPIAEDLGVPVVPYSRWLESLEMVASHGSDNPGVRLLEFFRQSEESSEDEAFFPARLYNMNGLEISGTLSSLGPLGSQDAKEWVGYLREIGYLS